MWRYALFVSAVVAVDDNKKYLNSSSAAVLSSNSPQRPSSITAPPLLSQIETTLSDHQNGPSSSRSLSSPSSRPTKDSNTSTVITGPCTGCIIQAYYPLTYSFEAEYNPWTSLVVTETILTQITTYFDGSTIDTIVTQEQTVNQTKTAFGAMNETITHTTPVLTIWPTSGTYLTFPAGPTYVFYDNIDGGLDEQIDVTNTALKQKLRTCAPYPTKFNYRKPTALEDWEYFIQAYTNDAPKQTLGIPIPLPSKLIGFLKQDPYIVSQYRGSDIATCTQQSSFSLATPTVSGVPDSTISLPKSTTTRYRPEPPPMSIPADTEPAASQGVQTSTYLSTTYESTSTHITMQGCLRCQHTTSSNDLEPSGRPIPNIINNPSSASTYQPTDLNDLSDKPKPADPNEPNPQAPAGQSITIGNSVFPINTARPTQNNDPAGPKKQDQALPVIVIGSETLTLGQTKTINGIPVVAPTDGGGSRLVVDGSTVAINPAGPTGAPILTVDGNPITANAQGQFVLGTQTLNPGGPVITINGNTYSLGQSGTAEVNGVVQTLANAPAPTQAPVLVFNSQSIPATVISGTTFFVLGPGQTLAPGSVLTISGTTFSMPASASSSMVVVINGVTSALANGPAITAAPALTIDGKTYSAIIKEGTTGYVLGDGTTLTPGDAVTISGITYSLDPKGTELVVDGVTSSIHMTPASNSASTTASSLVPMSASSSTSSTTSGHLAGDFVGSEASESKKGNGICSHSRGLDKWVEGLVIGAAGWVVMLL